MKITKSLTKGPHSCDRQFLARSLAMVVSVFFLSLPLLSNAAIDDTSSDISPCKAEAIKVAEEWSMKLAIEQAPEPDKEYYKNNLKITTSDITYGSIKEESISNVIKVMHYIQNWEVYPRANVTGTYRHYEVNTFYYKKDGSCLKIEDKDVVLFKEK